MKHTMNGTIRIRACYNTEAQLLEVQVVDSGIGLMQREMGKLYNMFSKDKPIEKANTDGIGIGLVICQRIIEDSGGKIFCSTANDEN